MQSFYKLCFSLFFAGIISTSLIAQMRGPEEEPFVPGELIVQIDRNVDLYKTIESLPSEYGFYCSSRAFSVYASMACELRLHFDCPNGCA